MEIRWIQDFLAVAETGNFARAAHDRHSSQAAFSRRIQSLETWLGVSLVDRSVFPTKLTAAGEQFRDQAADILRDLLDARAELVRASGLPRDQIRIAIPHALATARLPGWWADWSKDLALSCEALPGNVHDTVTSLVSGDADLLIGFHHGQQPIHLDPDMFERITLGKEELRPYIARQSLGKFDLTGKTTAPVPLLSYANGTYLGRMVDLILETSGVPINGYTVFRSDMADILREMAATGAGVAWLPESTAERAADALIPLDGDQWAITLSIVAYRARNHPSRGLARIWSALA